MPIVNENEYFFPSSDGLTQIHVRRWMPDCDLNGVVQLAHGICEYVGRYEDFARYLASKGFVVVANDHLGHGQSVRSPEYLGYFARENGWEKVVMDMERLRQLTSREFPELPYFIFGHSMGSFLTRTWLIEHPEVPLAGVILCGTGQPAAPIVMGGRLMCDVDIAKNGPMHRSSTIHGTAFGSYNKEIENPRTPYDWISRDEAIVDAYAADPLCTFIPTSALFWDMMYGVRFIGSARNAARMNKSVPVLFISGDADPVGGYGIQVANVYGLFCRAGMQDVHYKFYEGARHELLNETNRETVKKDVLDWIFKKIG